MLKNESFASTLREASGFFQHISLLLCTFCFLSILSTTLSTTKSNWAWAVNEKDPSTQNLPHKLRRCSAWIASTDTPHYISHEEQDKKDDLPPWLSWTILLSGDDLNVDSADKNSAVEHHKVILHGSKKIRWHQYDVEIKLIIDTLIPFITDAQQLYHTAQLFDPPLFDLGFIDIEVVVHPSTSTLHHNTNHEDYTLSSSYAEHLLTIDHAEMHELIHQAVEDSITHDFVLESQSPWKKYQRNNIWKFTSWPINLNLKAESEQIERHRIHKAFQLTKRLIYYFSKCTRLSCSQPKLQVDKTSK